MTGPTDGEVEMKIIEPIMLVRLHARIRPGFKTGATQGSESAGHSFRD